MEAKKVSVIIPVYNAEKYIEDCLSSVLGQTYSNIEILLINDGSIDKSLEICHEVGAKHDNILVINQPNGGAGSARNAGLEKCSGDYVCFVDSDDYIHPSMLEIMISYLDSDSIDIVECETIEVDDYVYESPLDKSFVKREQITVETKKQYLKRIVLYGQTAVWRRIYKKELVQNIRFRSNIIAEDVYFTVDVSKNIKNKIVHVSFPFYKYLRNYGSVTKSKYSEKHLQSIDASLYLQQELIGLGLDRVVRIHMLKKLILHYKKLFHNHEVDTSFDKRRWIKQKIKENFVFDIRLHIHIWLSRFLSVHGFGKVLEYNQRIKN
ncbi:glycosyltransferase [Flagellimonas olearia]|uniref:Glycosyltransferase n=1 Tax=Flagellimonas olearia TaxID=552546 RepID=A0A6I1DYE4_9FLAO|nr:glycosyltransferase [Allomuricauda olearia]KAB7530493.1 glycosyltransferase [Allomuricauda olearia]